MAIEDPQEEIISELSTLNESVKRQNAIWHIFVTGVIYGIGFVVGSAILASIMLGIFWPVIGNIPWVRDTFQRGSAVMHH